MSLSEIDGKEVDLILDVVLQHFRGLPQFGGQDQWTRIAQSASQYARETKSTPFSEAASAADQLADQPTRIHTDSRAPIPPQLQGGLATLADVLCNEPIFSEATTALQNCPLWVKTLRHVQLHFKASSRTVIDSILIWASDIAQNLIIRFPELDKSLQLRHGFGDQKGAVEIDDQVHDIHSWVALHQGITVPPQILSPGVSFHGKLNYVVGILDASMVDEDLNDGKCSTTVY
ncbi:hypothetical protein C8R45DRAFT_1091827 [Mycena sanguinolenta]|nr:hypothetical protein C8R45DRAFT_1091827 [Mycena sanguinolenta]